MIRVLILLSLILLNLPAKAYVGVFYYDNMFGHIHLRPNRFSSSVTTVACGHPIKVIEGLSIAGLNWFSVKVGPVKGNVMADYLSPERPKCFQDKYPKFFNSLNLDLAQLYYWGRLYDQYLMGRSKVQ